MKNENEHITSEVKASKLVPLAEACVKKIKQLREEEDTEFLKDFMDQYNARWYNKLFRNSFKNIEEVKEYIDNNDHEMFPSWYWIYPSTNYSMAEDAAKEIIKFYKHGNMDAIYTIPVEIYNAMANLTK